MSKIIVEIYKDRRVRYIEHGGGELCRVREWLRYCYAEFENEGRVLQS